jgi:hypothetical protein
VRSGDFLPSDASFVDALEGGGGDNPLKKQDVRAMNHLEDFCSWMSWDSSVLFLELPSWSSARSIASFWRGPIKKMGPDIRLVL